MRRLYAVVAASLLGAVAVLARPAAPFYWKVSDAAVSGLGDSLRVTMTFRFGGELPSREAVIFSPVLSHGEYDVALRPVVVRGRKLLDRSVSGDDSEIVAMSDTLRYEWSVPRREWMDTCSVAVVESGYARKTGIRYRSRRSCGDFRRPSEPAVALPWNLMEPEHDDGTARTVEFPLVLAFEGKSKDVVERLGDNAELLAEFDSLLRPLFRGRTPKVKGLHIESYTSPDGAEKANMTLTRNRLTSLNRYLSQKGTFAKRTAVLAPKGEDWDGMVEWISASDRTDDMRLHEILEGQDSPDVLEELLRREKPVLWDDLVQLRFPELERFVCRVEYVPMSYATPDDALAMYRISSAFLSPRDFWMAAGAVEEGGDEWCDILLDAVSFFPGDEACRTNAVLALTSIGYLDQAAVWLRDSGGGSESVLARAIWLYRKGMYEGCVALMETLKGKGGVYDMCWSSIDAWWKWKTGRQEWEVVIP